MNSPVRLLAFAGSTRRDSWNKKLVHLAAESARQAGAEVTVADIRDYPMPLYDGDLEAEQGMPVPAREFKKLFVQHDGILLASPEYNSSITAVLKNTLDWISRKSGPDDVWPFTGKWAAVMSASPGRLGGLRGLVHLRSILGNIDVHVLPDQVAIPTAHEAFDAEGRLKDPKQLQAVDHLARNLVRLLARVKGG